MKLKIAERTRIIRNAAEQGCEDGWAVAGEAFEKFELAAVWDDTRLGLRHFTGWEKMAVVSDIDWVRAAIKIFGLGMPGEVRVFHNRELAEAARWISE